MISEFGITKFLNDKNKGSWWDMQKKLSYIHIFATFTFILHKFFLILSNAVLSMCEISLGHNQKIFILAKKSWIYECNVTSLSLLIKYLIGNGNLYIACSLIITNTGQPLKEIPSYISQSFKHVVHLIIYHIFLWLCYSSTKLKRHPVMLNEIYSNYL